MEQRILNNDRYAFLGDRTLLRFEDGEAGQESVNLTDRFIFNHDGTAISGTGGTRPLFSSDTPNSNDLVLGEENNLSLDLEADLQHYMQINDTATFADDSSSSLDFGEAPFTIEAWVKLESLPTGNNAASAMPVVMKKVIGANDLALDYMFLAAAGHYGNALTFDKLALHLGSSVILSDLAISDNDWHHISVAFDPTGNTVRFTLDDQINTQITTASGATNDGPLIIGAHFTSASVIDSSFDGHIDEVSITDGFLALAEIQPLANVAEVTEFQIIDFEIEPLQNSIRISFESDDTRMYCIQKSDNLAEDSWVDLRCFVPGASGSSETSVADLPVDPDADKKFYRVAIVTR